MPPPALDLLLDRPQVPFRNLHGIVHGRNVTEREHVRAPRRDDLVEDEHGLRRLLVCARERLVLSPMLGAVPSPSTRAALADGHLIREERLARTSPRTLWGRRQLPAAVGDKGRYGRGRRGRHREGHRWRCCHCSNVVEEGMHLHARDGVPQARRGPAGGGCGERRSETGRIGLDLDFALRGRALGGTAPTTR